MNYRAPLHFLCWGAKGSPGCSLLAATAARGSGESKTLELYPQHWACSHHLGFLMYRNAELLFFSGVLLQHGALSPFSFTKQKRFFMPGKDFCYLLNSICLSLILMALRLLSFTQHHISGNWLPVLCHGLLLVPPSFHPHFAVWMSLVPRSLGSAAIRPRFLSSGEVIQFLSPASPLMLACLIREAFLTSWRWLFPRSGNNELGGEHFCPWHFHLCKWS